MRLPNGYGTVVKLAGNRRKPWRVRKTRGWEVRDGKKVKQLFEELGCYATKAEALKVLSENIIVEGTVRKSKYTFENVYDLFSTEEYPKMSSAMVKSHTISYRICTPIHGSYITDIKLQDLQKIVDESGKNLPTLEKFKGFINAFFTYAKTHEYINQERLDNIRYLDISRAENPNKLERKVFTDEELEKIWEGNKNIIVKLVLILVYSGVRIGELIDLKSCDVHLDEQYFRVQKSKTNSGIRDVPIADKVLDLWKELYDPDQTFMFRNSSNNQFKYNNFLDNYWNPYMDSMGFKHTPHDARHTCISRLKSAGVQDHVIKKIVGHKGTNITDSVYTHVNIMELIEAINII